VLFVGLKKLKMDVYIFKEALAVAGLCEDLLLLSKLLAKKVPSP
jgi:hypothetical protein